MITVHVLVRTIGAWILINILACDECLYRFLAVLNVYTCTYVYWEKGLQVMYVSMRLYCIHLQFLHTSHLVTAHLAPPLLIEERE